MGIRKLSSEIQFLFIISFSVRKRKFSSKTKSNCFQKFNKRAKFHACKAPQENSFGKSTQFCVRIISQKYISNSFINEKGYTFIFYQQAKFVPKLLQYPAYISINGVSYITTYPENNIQPFWLQAFSYILQPYMMNYNYWQSHETKLATVICLNAFTH